MNEDELPDSFTFRFGDMPQYLHRANKDDEGQYQIAWDQAHINENGVNWYDCSELEILEFIAEKDGWVIQ